MRITKLLQLALEAKALGLTVAVIAVLKAA